jgi:hypothetical protein
MFQSQTPKVDELPTSRQLLRSTLLAMAIAALLLVTVVLPAEYGVDPTGVGGALGLAEVGRIKQSLAAEIVAEQAAVQEATTPAMKTVSQATPEEPLGRPAEGDASGSTSEIRADEIRLTLQPDEGAEVKVTLREGEAVEYEWSSNGGKLNFDTHADSKELAIKYHGYGKGSSEKAEGELVAAFDGNHGWFWRNRTAEALELKVELEGPYTDIVRWP